jgi:hypothetical protein
MKSTACQFKPLVAMICISVAINHIAQWAISSYPDAEQEERAKTSCLRRTIVLVAMTTSGNVLHMALLATAKRTKQSVSIHDDLPSKVTMSVITTP